jgi:hypothetical protein
MWPLPQDNSRFGHDKILFFIYDRFYINLNTIVIKDQDGQLGGYYKLAGMWETRNA